MTQSPLPTSVLACVGPGANAETVIRSAARLATQTGRPWHAVYVETPRLRRLPEALRGDILARLKLARELGASTTVLEAGDPAQALAQFARGQQVSALVLGRSSTPRKLWQRSMLRRLAAYLPHAELTETGPGGANQSLAAPDAAEAALPFDAAPRSRFVLAIGVSLLTALLAIPLVDVLDLSNVAMLLLMSVVLVAIGYGRAAAFAAACTSFAALLLLAPSHAFGTGDLKHGVAFVVMLAVGWITADLTSTLRYQANVATQREARTRALYEFARELSGVLQTEQVFDITRQFVQSTFHAQATLLLPDDSGRLHYPPRQDGEVRIPTMSVVDMAAAQWAYTHAAAAGAATSTLPTNSFFYLPLVAPMRTRGVMMIWAERRNWLLVPDQRELLEAFAALAAIALERVHYVEVAQEAVVHMESERLRNSLLAALSHDLRTPLTSLVGLSESLVLSRPPLAAVQLELANALGDEARRMSTLVANLLEMARIQSGAVKLNMQWQSIEEVIGSALRASRLLLAERRIRTELERDLPLVRFDATLLERVLCNLLENACKYTPRDAQISVGAQITRQLLEVHVRDNGAGLPPGREDALFEKFVRGERESSIPGVGLGLAICRAIVEAHGGTIHAYNDGGAVFSFTLPLGEPPAIPEPL
jgi:two-component system sensor histidine kinase KdpD